MDYDTISSSYNGLYEEEQIKKLEIVKKRINFDKNSELLDLGCGTTISTNFFKCKTIGVDNSINMLLKGKGNRVLSSAEKLPFKDKSFDIIICITSIHNFSSPKKAVKEILRVKKKNAQIVITLLKKSINYNKIKKLIISNFKVKEIDEQKDTIFIGN